jgi:hypothetical protein
MQRCYPINKETKIKAKAIASYQRNVAFEFTIVATKQFDIFRGKNTGYGSKYKNLTEQCPASRQNTQSQCNNISSHTTTSLNRHASRATHQEIIRFYPKQLAKISECSWSICFKSKITPSMRRC